MVESYKPGHPVLTDYVMAPVFDPEQRTNVVKTVEQLENSYSRVVRVYNNTKVQVDIIDDFGATVRRWVGTTEEYRLCKSVFQRK